MTLSVGERRIVGTRAADDAAFQTLLMRDPRRAIEESLGRKVPGECAIDVVLEGEEWAFVLLDPRAIEVDLPEPVDLRGQIENQVYALLREDADLHAEAESDPRAFVRRWLGPDLGETPIVLLYDTPKALKILIPNRDDREILSDDMLDLVSAGGGCPPLVGSSKSELGGS